MREAEMQRRSAGAIPGKSASPAPRGRGSIPGGRWLGRGEPHAGKSDPENKQNLRKRGHPPAEFPAELSWPDGHGHHREHRPDGPIDSQMQPHLVSGPVPKSRARLSTQAATSFAKICLTLRHRQGTGVAEFSRHTSVA